MDAAIEGRIEFLKGKAESLYSLKIYFVILFEGFRYKQALVSSFAKLGSEPREAQTAAAVKTGAFTPDLDIMTAAIAGCWRKRRPANSHSVRS